jgi:hypothetical protein
MTTWRQTKGAATDIDRAASLPMDVHRGELSAAVIPGGECRQSANSSHTPNSIERPVNIESGYSGMACDLYPTNLLQR